MKQRRSFLLSYQSHICYVAKILFFLFIKLPILIKLVYFVRFLIGTYLYTRIVDFNFQSCVLLLFLHKDGTYVLYSSEFFPLKRINNRFISNSTKLLLIWSNISCSFPSHYHSCKINHKIFFVVFNLSKEIVIEGNFLPIFFLKKAALQSFEKSTRKI